MYIKWFNSNTVHLRQYCTIFECLYLSICFSGNLRFVVCLSLLVPFRRNITSIVAPKFTAAASVTTGGVAIFTELALGGLKKRRREFMCVSCGDCDIVFPNSLSIVESVLVCVCVCACAFLCVCVCIGVELCHAQYRRTMNT